MRWQLSYHAEKFHRARRHPLCKCPDKPDMFGNTTYIAFQEDCAVRHFLTQEDIDAILGDLKTRMGFKPGE